MEPKTTILIEVDLRLFVGERLSDVFEAGVAVVRAKKPQLVDKLTNSFG